MYINYPLPQNHSYFNFGKSMNEKLNRVNTIIKPKEPIVVRYFDSEIKIEETELSLLSPFPACIVLTLPELIGTHENTIPEGLKGIDYSEGWKGPAIAVATLNERLLDKLGEGVHVVENIEYGDMGVLDGHHRREVAEIEGLAYVVTQIFPLISPHIIIATWLDNFTPLTPEEVASYFKDREKVVTPKATKFQILGNDGVARRILHMQPNIAIPRNILENRL